MIGVFDKLNVRPEERRYAIMFFFGAFILLNGLWAWRHFGGSTEWSALSVSIEEARGEKNSYEERIKNLEKKQKEWEDYKKRFGAGAGMAQYDPLPRVQRLAADSKFSPGSMGRNKVEDAEFKSFDRYVVSMDFTASDASLINFLVELGREPEMVRVSDLTISRGDREKATLRGQMSVVASLPKKTDSTNQKSKTKPKGKGP